MSAPPALDRVHTIGVRIVAGGAPPGRLWAAPASHGRRPYSRISSSVSPAASIMLRMGSYASSVTGSKPEMS